MTFLDNFSTTILWVSCDLAHPSQEVLFGFLHGEFTYLFSRVCYSHSCPLGYVIVYKPISLVLGFQLRCGSTHIKTTVYKEFESFTYYLWVSKVSHFNFKKQISNLQLTILTIDNKFAFKTKTSGSGPPSSNCCITEICDGFSSTA